MKKGYSMATVQSFGAAEVVTGSCHLLELDKGLTIMIDCGMFQGKNEDKNRQNFGFDPKKVDILLITHAHLDHVGRIPKLVKEGFSGKVITLRSTMDLAQVVLLDSAHLMEEEFSTRFRKAQRRGDEQKVEKPLYTTEDVEDVYNLSMEFPNYDETIKIRDDVYVTFRNAGHILDSAIIEIAYKEDNQEKCIVFSGDLGNYHDMVMPIPTEIKKANTLYIESTYGDRNHKDIKESEAEFKEAVQNTLLSQGSVLIPSFAIERTQEILCILKKMYDKNELPKCKVFLDSPMAIRATNLYNLYHEELSECCNEFLMRDGTIFDFPYLHYTLKPDDSKKINQEESCIIIAGSGMCTGGRILHHFKNRLWNPKNSLIFVGYQADGTLGRKIVEGAEFIKLYHEKIKINAKVYTINGFSAHADQKELLTWIGGFDELDKIYLIHGEREKQEIFKKAITSQLHKKVHIVKEKETILL
jgi:metallo-beta-lactamase family protein